MSDPILSKVGRGAASGFSRRLSASVTLAAVGTAALSAVARPSAQAGKTGRKTRKRCQRQVGACRQTVTTHCMGNAGCLETNLPFCEPFARCNGGAGLVRIFIAD